MNVPYVLICGCMNVVDANSGVKRCLSKCDFHVRELALQKKDFSGLAYYESLGAVVNGVPQCAKYIEELWECLGLFPRGEKAYALEIGCGCSMYAPALLSRGYVYQGLDPDPRACEWTRNTFNCTVKCTAFDETSAREELGGWHVILCAHALEHMPDAPGALALMRDLLIPGGYLYLLVPDDTDECNPDHTWFFSEATLAACLKDSGFEVEIITSRKRIERENFIYCKARKG